MLQLKIAIQRISSASSQKPDPASSQKPKSNVGRPRKPKVLSDIESDDTESNDGGKDVAGKKSVNKKAVLIPRRMIKFYNSCCESDDTNPSNPLKPSIPSLPNTRGYPEMI